MTVMTFRVGIPFMPPQNGTAQLDALCLFNYATKVLFMLQLIANSKKTRKLSRNLPWTVCADC